MDELCFEDNRLLFGSDPTEGIVAAELAGRFIRLFIRNDKGVTFRDAPFHPFILLADDALLSGSSIPYELTPLQGPGEFRLLATFLSWHDCMGARDYLTKKSGRTPSATDAPYLYLSDPVHQHLLLTGKTLFKGIEFQALKRMALDIETACAPGFQFSNPKRTEDRIISIALVDSTGFEEVISGRELDEKRMLERLGEIIREQDPDVIEGHNLFRFDLEYIRERAAMHKVPLKWGRDASEPKVRHSRFTVAERTVDYPRWDIYGRSIIDTYFLLLIYDVSSRDLESYGLKSAARHFGLSSPDRVYLEGDAINRAFTEEPDTLTRYNLDDARETLALSGLLSYPHFLQARIFPYSYQNCPIRGNATKINSLFMREYLRRCHAIPIGGGEANFEGGYTDIFRTGVVGPVVHCDVASLYPSLILAYDMRPDKDKLDLFLPLLKELRRFRLQAKKMAQSAVDPRQHDYYQALQQTFKVLINSFYGYLGTTIHNFSDPEMAAEVARRGRETLQQMLEWLRAHGAEPIEVDTDGVYFIPPLDVTTEEAEERLVQELSSTMPSGIKVERDGRWETMFSYKMKNYALLGHDGAITIKGSSLKSRGMEKYLRLFMEELLVLLLHRDWQRIEPLFHDYLEKLRDHRFPISHLAKTETLSEAPDTYSEKVRKGKRNPSALYELARSSEHDYRAGDQISYYVTGHGKNVSAHANCKLLSEHDPQRPDENIPYYGEKLKDLYQRISRLFRQEPVLFS
jgi:DNA polymerase elongation subunit (family B)